MEPSISDDGRYVSFSTATTNFVSGDTNTTFDAFVTPRALQPTTLALFRPSFNAGLFINTLQDLLPSNRSDSYTLVAPGSITGSWVMGA